MNFISNLFHTVFATQMKSCYFNISSINELMSNTMEAERVHNQT